MDREVFTAAELAFRGIAVGAIAGGGYLVGAEKTPPMNTK
jgi:hypothetical protein